MVRLVHVFLCCVVTVASLVAIVTWTGERRHIECQQVFLVTHREITWKYGETSNHVIKVNSKRKDFHESVYFDSQRGSQNKLELNINESNNNYKTLNLLKSTNMLSHSELNLTIPSNVRDSEHWSGHIENKDLENKSIASQSESRYISYFNEYSKLNQSRSPVEIRHIGFLKVHKTGSSTMQNILFRFGLRRNLTFVLPKASNYFSQSIHEHSEVLPIPINNHYDILCNHAVFNAREFRKYLPADTRYVAIIREPVAQFISAVNYFHSQEYLREVQTRWHRHWLHRLIWITDNYNQTMFSHTRNSMAKDFGFQSVDTIFHNAYLDYINRTFSFVIITEKYDESLVLLKRHFRLEMADIMYIPNMVNKRTRKYELNESDINKLRQTNYVDFQLYDVFLSRLNNLIARESNNFSAEVRHFKKLLGFVRSHCSKQWDHHPLVIQASPWNSEFAVSHQTCRYMQMEPLDLQDHMRKRHISQWNLGFSFAKIANNEMV